METLTTSLEAQNRTAVPCASSMSVNLTSFPCYVPPISVISNCAPRSYG